MSIRGFVLGVMLLAAVGWCMVQESIKQTRARYTLAELTRRENEMEQRLEKLQATEDALRSPARLAALVREQKMELVALGCQLPQLRGRGDTARGPGEVLDKEYPGLEMASAGNW